MRRVASLAACTLLLALAAALYFPHAGIPYFADDYLHWSIDPRAALTQYFWTAAPAGFRPLQMAWCALNEILFNDKTFVLQAGQALLHGLLGYLIYSFMRRCTLGGAASLLTAGLFVLNPANVSAVLGNDTGSQVASTLFGFLSFSLAWQYASRLTAPANTSGGRGGSWLVAFSIVALVLALLAKETGLSFSGIVPLMLIYVLWRDHGRPRRGAAPRLIGLIAACIVVTGLYFAYRRSVAPVNIAYGESGPYDFKIGINVIKNEAFLFVAAFLPFSTVDTFVAAVHRNRPVLAGIGAGTAIWLALLCVGVTRAKAWRSTIALILLAACAGVPMVFMNHVSELYAYNLAPFVSIVAGVSLAALLIRTPHTSAGPAGRRPGTSLRAVAGVLLLAVIVSDVRAIHRKSAQMAIQGADATALIPQVVDFARQLPPGGTLVLAERTPREQPYSVFVQTDFYSLNAADLWIKHLAGRPDTAIALIRDGEGEAELQSASLILVREDTPAGPRVRPVPAK